MVLSESDSYKLEGNPVWTIEQTANTTTNFENTEKFINRSIDYYKVTNIAEKKYLNLIFRPVNMFRENMI